MSEPSKHSSTRADAKVEVNRPGLRAIRYALAAGEELSPHFAPRDVLIVVLSGNGHVSIDGRIVPVKAGSIVELLGERQGVVADEALRFVVIQAELDPQHLPRAMSVPAPISLDGTASPSAH